MKKFELGPRHTLAIVSYIAASMGYSKEDIKRIVGNVVKIDNIDDFHKILVEPLDKVKQINNPVQKGTVDLVIPFNLAERIQKVIDLILEKIDNSYLSGCQELRTATIMYKNSPLRFDNFIRNPKEEPVVKAEPKMTAREEYLRGEAEIEKFDEERLEMLKEHDKQHELLESIDEAVRKATDETLRDFKDKLDGERWKEMIEEAVAKINGGTRFSSQANMYNRPFYSRPFSQGNQQTHSNFVPGSSPFSSKHIVNEIDEINQVIDNLIGFRDRLIAKLGYDQFKEKEQSKEPQEPKEQPNINWDNVQKAQESPAAFEPVKFTEEQRQRQREILGDLFGSTSRYDQVANEKVKKLSEYSIRHSTQHLFDEALRNRTEEEAMISRSIEIYPSTNLCKDSLNTRNFKYPSDFKGLFSFVRVDGDRLYRINDSSVQPWNRSKPLGTIRMISENFGLFTSTKITIKVNEDAVEEYVDEYFDNPYVILDAVNSKYGYSIAPEDISVDQVFGTPSLETPNRYLFRHSYYRVADEVKASLKESRNKFIKGLVRDSAIVVLNDKELYDWIKGGNPTNS
jgi:hypothetical protein